MIEQQRPSETARALAKNTLYNLITQVVLVLVSFWSFPILVRGLSAEGFGLLSLLWVLIGYFSLLDLGVSRAITKFVAEALAQGDHRRIHRITWTALTLSVLLGSVVALLIVATREIVMDSFFHTSGAMRAEALTSIAIASVGIPFMLANGMLRGVQAGFQRFDMVNAFQAVMGGTQWLGSVAIVLAGGGVREVVLLTVFVRVASAACALALLPSLSAGAFSAVRLWDPPLARSLLSFGGWVSVSQVISPLFLYVDRFMIGSFMTLTAVAHYTVPQETVNRMLILPLSLTTALYPVFSGHPSGRDGSLTLGTMYGRSVKYVTLLMLPLSVILFIFAPEILRLWMGQDFALQSGLALRILAVGFFFNAVAQIPATALHALGRPDLPAKYNALELPLMIGLNLILIPRMGIAGAALAWSVRVACDAALLFHGIASYVRDEAIMLDRRWKTLPILGSLAAQLALLFATLLVENQLLRGAASLLLIALYAMSTWKYAFDDADRGFLLHLRTRFFP